MGLMSGLENVLGIKTDAGNSELRKALEAIQGVKTPTAQELSLPELQKYVQQGLLTPDQYQAILADPDTYSRVISATGDNSGMTAQKAALQQLGGVVQAGGSTDINKANLINNIDTTNQAMKGARGAIMQNAQERGVSGGGLEFMKQLTDEQGNAEVANKGAVNSAANNAQLALQAMSQQGSLGGQLQGQSNQMAQSQAEAAKQIAEYNAQLQSQAEAYNAAQMNEAQKANLSEKQRISDTNTGGANSRLAYNAQLPQTVFQDQMGKAGAMAGVYGDQAKNEQAHAQQDAAFTGGLIGAGATLGGSYLAGQTPKAPPAGTGLPNGADVSSGGYSRNSALVNPYLQPNKNPYGNFAHGGEVRCYAQGGEVHDHNLCMAAGGPVEGDSEANDTVPAMLSPHEIVLPRSVATAPDAPQKAAEFVGGIKSGQLPNGATTDAMPKVSSFAEALKILEENGLELRLQTREG